MSDKQQILVSSLKWRNAQPINTLAYTCGHCNHKTSANRGIMSDNLSFASAICSYCNKPSVFNLNPSYLSGKVSGFTILEQTPGAKYGNKVNHVPSMISELYEEARSCTTNNNFTASVMCCRKILMHIAVEEGAKEDLSFVKYVSYLVDKGFVPPKSEAWVTKVKDKGNEVNHEIILMTNQDAETTLKFVEMMLKYLYEFPNET